MFFERLSAESGVDETDIRDILNLTADGSVQVTQPTKDLGNSLSEQARTVTVLVASARAIGLAEKPVDGAAVRKELERKRCYDGGNFAKMVIGKLKGINAGSTSKEIVTTS